MLLLISPAKTLDFSKSTLDKFTFPRLLNQSEELIKVLKKKSSKDLQTLMHVSEKIANLNVERYKKFETPFTTENAKQAILAFKGDVYTGLNASEFSKRDFNFAQKHLRILSGLYGILNPYDLIQAYRLEMGTKLKIGKTKNLYEIWGDTISELINNDLEENKYKYIINLASQEYFKAVNPQKLNGELYHIQFKEWRNEKYKIISFSAKKARGMMCQYVIKNRLKRPEQMKLFNLENYEFNESLSSEKLFTFTR